MSNRKLLKTGNLAADMILSCIAHYSLQNRIVDFVSLSPTYWDMFRVFVGKQNEKAEIDMQINGAIKFKSIVVKKGSPYQREPIIAEFDGKTMVATGRAAQIN